MSHSSGYAVFHDPGGTTRRRNAAPLIPGTWIHLCSHFPWFSFRIYGVEANFFLSSPFALYLFWNIERERATIKKYAQKFLLQRSSNRSSKELDERSKKFSLSLETETLRKSRIEINHPGEERAIKIKSRRRSGDISFPETIFRNAPPFLTDHAPNFYAPFLSHSRPAP